MQQNKSLSVGIDIGSTTAKVVVCLDGKTIFSCYERHRSQVRQKTIEILKATKDLLGNHSFHVAISGSAGMGMAKAANVPFVQEVFATAQAVRHYIPDADAVIELGGEDAKILFFDPLTGATEERMNGSCAGGTGAFIDQMATLLNMTPTELDLISQTHEHIYTIASRCGVFAKTDIQPLLNQGAKKSDIAASIFQAVVDQTITGLAQGRKIKGKVVFLGGPLYFFKELGRRFVTTLALDEKDAVFPEYALYAVAMGTSICATRQNSVFMYDELMARLTQATEEGNCSGALPPLFETPQDYAAFQKRHSLASVPKRSIDGYQGNIYIGIDCGSTTTKLVVLGQDGSLLHQYYQSNLGNPVEVVREQLIWLLQQCPERSFVNDATDNGGAVGGITVAGVAVTGYGEELIQNAFCADAGLVETIAHLKAAQHFNPDVDFVLDIGGQDIKCFHLKNGMIDNIILNEACSSGCGSFIETFAKSMGHTVADFSELGVASDAPVDLGSRCTVFMNSSVKQAQKEGASVENISAGLSMSVTKNAIYKVIRAASKESLGKHIVVQGGTFLNDAVLRSFELEIGREVIRPSIAGLMGAYGAALHAMELGLACSSLLSLSALQAFAHKANTTHCRLCSNHCNLTISTFGDHRKFVSGARCERPLGKATSEEKLPNIYNYKLNKLLSLRGVDGGRGKIGLPLGLNMFENLPFWHTFFTTLGFEVVLSDLSSRTLYRSAQDTIPSDTVCYPAKLMHGHIQNLIDKGVGRIFYPCMPYNVDEKYGDNHYNCPVVAFYPELLEANMTALEQVTFYKGYHSLHHKKVFSKNMHKQFQETGDVALSLKEIKHAAKQAFAALEQFGQEVREQGERMITFARAHHKQMMVLCGRPYHIDPEINHGIDQLLQSLGLIVLSEDAVAHLGSPQPLSVLNQWTYHARLYRAAEFVKMQPDMQLIQMISFGCGIDSISSDEVQRILEHAGKLYTQLKIDEINNLGAVKIRIRSLLAAIQKQKTFK